VAVVAARQGGECWIPVPLAPPSRASSWIVGLRSFAMKDARIPALPEQAPYSRRSFAVLFQYCLPEALECASLVQSCEALPHNHFCGCPYGRVGRAVATSSQIWAEDAAPAIQASPAETETQSCHLNDQTSSISFASAVSVSKVPARCKLSSSNQASASSSVMSDGHPYADATAASRSR
jgi:hypothetical protein